MIDLVAVGHKIARLRTSQGYSQDKLANALLVSRQAISNWEIGKAIPSIDNIIELSKIFGVSFEDILCLNENTTIDPQNVFANHDRKYVVHEYLSGSISVPFSTIFYEATGEERMLLLRGVKEHKVSVSSSEILPLLNENERHYYLESKEDKNYVIKN
jgi:transcriptional regulator with XRE-family HTH domain